MTPHAAAAKEIRKTLKANFPNTLFKVQSSSFSMGNAVDIYIGGRAKTVNGFDVDKNCENYKLRERVKSMVSMYQYGKFDGMTDCYEYTNRQENIPQVKYIHISCMD